MKGYIYLIYDYKEHKNYVGQSTRMHELHSYYGSGLIIKRKLKKYGRKNFKKTILKYCDTREDLNFWEDFYVRFYSSTNSDFGYNLQKGGSRDYIKPITEETKRKISNTLKGRIRPKEETEKARLSNLKNNRKMSEKHKKVLSKSMMGNTRRTQGYTLTDIYTNEVFLFNQAKDTVLFLKTNQTVFQSYVNGYRMRNGKKHTKNYENHIYKNYLINKL